MAAETGFTIDDVVYEVPGIDTLSMDEIQVLYDYSRLTLEDFMVNEDATGEEEEERNRALRNPGLMRAMMHIAYQRGNPKVNAAKVKALIGSANVISALESLAGDDAEEEAVPLVLTIEPEQPSLSGSVGSSESSGNGSTTVSEGQDVPPTPIGTGRSAISSPESLLTTPAG